MARFRRIPFKDPNRQFAQTSIASATLPFVQQLRIHLTVDGTVARRTSYAAVVHDDATVCWLDLENDRLMTSAPAPIALTLLQKLLAEEHPPLHLAPLTQEMFVQRAKVSSNLPLRPTLWNIGLAATRLDRLVTPMPMDAKLRLHRWPDFRILAHRPDHFRICALLIKQGASVQACCDILDMPKRTVQSFFNAAFLTAYAFPVMGEDAPVRPSPTDGLVNLWRQLRIRWSA